MLRSDPPLATRVARHYDDLDPYYRTLWGEHVHHGLWRRGDERPEEAVDGLLRHVAGRAAIARGDAVCDIGSGYGAGARFLARELGARVTALTVSRVQHEHALAAAPVEPSPDYRHADFLSADLPDAAFDAAIAIESLSHMDDLDAAMRQARRVLRPGGRLVACVWLAAADVDGWRRRLLLDPIRDEGRLARLATAEDVVAALRRAGFSVDRQEDLSSSVRRTWTVCLSRMVRRILADPRTWPVLLRGGEAVFALTVGRIWLAYRVGALRYGVFTAS